MTFQKNKRAALPVARSSSHVPFTANQPCTLTMEYPKYFNLETRSGGILHCVNGRLLSNVSTRIWHTSSRLNGPVKNFIVASTRFVLGGTDQGVKYEASVNIETSRG
jgi:hypothetical protein